MAVTSSVRANRSPMHLCLPAPKGRYAPGVNALVCASSSQRSGLKLGVGKQRGVAVQGVLAVGEFRAGGERPWPQACLGDGATGDEPPGVVQPQRLPDDAVEVRQVGKVLERDGSAFEDRVEFVEDRAFDVGVAGDFVQRPGQHRGCGLGARHGQSEDL